MYLVLDIEDKQTIMTGRHTQIEPIIIKNDKCIISNDLYIENKDIIDELQLNYIIREVLDTEFIEPEEII